MYYIHDTILCKGYYLWFGLVLLIHNPCHRPVITYVLDNYLKNFLCIYSITGRSSRGLPTIRHLSGNQTTIRNRSDIRTHPRHVCASRTLGRLKNLLHRALVPSPLVCFLVHQVYARDCRQWQDTFDNNSPKPVCKYRLRVLFFRFLAVYCFASRLGGWVTRDISAACGSTKTFAISWSSNILIN